MRSIRSALLVTAALVVTGSTSPLARAASPVQALSTALTLKLLGASAPSQPVEFDVILPLRNAAALDALLAQQQDPSSPQYHHWLKPTDFAARFGADQPTVMRVAAALQLFGLQVTAQSRSLHVVGTASQVNQAFNVSLLLASDPLGRQRLISGQQLVLPSALSNAGAVISAFKAKGFDAAPLVRQSSVGYVRQSSVGYVRQSSVGYVAPATQSSPAGGYFYNDLKQAYSYPSYQTTMTVKGKSQHLDGTGATVAVLMASDVLDSDISTLFDHQNFAANSGQGADPAIYARRLVNGGAVFSADSAASEEATVDVQQVLGGAPGSHVILYNTPDMSDQSLISGYTAIVNDNTADVVSMSFGQCELYYTAAYNSGQDQTAILSIYSELFKQGNAQGITFVAASGDSAGRSCINPEYFSGSAGQFITGVSEPATDPNVTAVGGTNLVAAQAADGSGSSYLNENAWSDPEIGYDPYGMGTTVTGGIWGAGGGVSTLYPKPSYQYLVTTGSSSFRAVPDVGMEMGGCPDIAQAPCNGGNMAGNGSGNTDRSYVNVVFNGYWDSVIGTSAAAPAMASAVALLVQTQGRQGNLNPYLYTLAHGQASGGPASFNQSVPGFNGVAANAGTYNFTTGNGTLNVSAMLGLFHASLAGSPQSASNP